MMMKDFFRYDPITIEFGMIEIKTSTKIHKLPNKHGLNTIQTMRENLRADARGFNKWLKLFKICIPHDEK